MQHSDMLQWFTQPAVAQRAVAGGTIVTADEMVHCTADSLCDDALDADLGHLQRCFSDVATVSRRGQELVPTSFLLMKTSEKPVYEPFPEISGSRSRLIVSEALWRAFR